MAKTRNKAVFVSQVTVIDPDTKQPVEVTIYKDLGSGGMVGVDSSFITSNEPDTIPSPFDKKILLILTED